MKKLINKFRFFAVAVLSLAAIGGVAFYQQPAFAAECKTPAECIGAPVKDLNKGGKELIGENGDGYLRDITNTLLFVVGAIAVIVIIIGGLKYVTADGDASKIKGAKDTILYAIVGIVIAILAFAIVNFIIGSFVSQERKTTQVSSQLLNRG